MKRTKRVLALAMALTVLFTACASGSGTQQPAAPSGDSAAPSQAAQPPQEAGGSDMTPQQWAEANGLNKTESVDELYAAAKEEGELHIYSCSGRMETVIATFMEDYPGINAVFYDLTNNEIYEKYAREYEAGIRVMDIMHVKDQNGTLYKEFIQTGLVHNYHPDDIYDGVDPSLMSVTPMYMELDWWYYNPEVYGEMPIDSWWDLTRPEWKGKFTLLDPTGEPGILVLFAAMMQQEEEFAADYKREFGEDIVLADNEPTAVHALIRRMAQNSPIMESSNNNVVAAVGGTSGMTEAPLGYAVSSKLREVERQGWSLAVDPGKFHTNTTIYGLNCVQIANEAPHPNAAKLFLRYVVGEADHKGRGFDQFLTVGGFSIFPDGPDAPGNIPQSEIGIFPLDWDYYYSKYLDTRDYWISVQP